MCDPAGISMYTPYITAVGGIIFGGISSYLVGVKLSQGNHAKTIDLMKRQEFNNAAATFRVAFVDVIYYLRKGVAKGRVDVNAVLSDEIFAGQEKAKIIFETFLDSDRLGDFKTAWDNYKNYENRYALDKTLHSTTFN